MEIPERLKQIKNNYWAQLIGCFLFFFVIFSSYFLLPVFNSTDDQFFNIRFAEKLSVEGLSTLTNFDEFSFEEPKAWVYNPLFYVALIPFTWMEPLELGIKLFSVTAVALLMTALYAYFRVRKVSYSFAWTFIVSGTFLNATAYLHLLNARAFVLALLLLVLFFIALAKKQYAWVAVLSLLYFFTHSATFFFPVLISGIYTAFLLKDKVKNAWNALLASTVGLLAGIIVSSILFPSFLNHFFGFLETLSKIIFSFHGGGTEIAEGLESYPMTIYDIFSTYPIFGAFVFIVLGIQGHLIWKNYREKKVVGEPLDMTLFFLTILFLLGTLITKRNLDFFFIFSILYTVPLAAKWFVQNISIFSQVARRTILAVAVLTLVSQIFVYADRIANAPWYGAIETAADWLQANTEENSIVFNPTMNNFPTFYFFNEGHNRVIVGIEPRNFYDHDPAKYWKWINLAERGVICDQPLCPEEMSKRDTARASEDEQWFTAIGERAKMVLLNDFQTNTVITTEDFEFFNEILEKSGAFEKVHETPVTGMYRVYQVKD